MSKFKITMKESGLRQVEQEAKRRAEEETRKAIDRVSREMAGKPEEEVFQRLVREMRTSIGATVTQDDPGFRKVAAEIAADDGAK